MIKRVVVCAALLTLGSPAAAKDRADEKAAPTAAGSVGHGRDPAVATSHVSRTALAQAPVRFVLPLRSLESRPIRSNFPITVPAAADRRFDLAQMEDSGVEASRLAETTADEGGRYAVREILSDYRKPRFRRTALGTMLTLRLDGEAESPAFSVGGGGVAAVVWQAMPKS